jgi:type II secretory pathway pseudopilin PulG
VELLVVLLVLGIVMAIATEFFINVTTGTASGDVRSQAENQLQLAMRTITEDVRAATSISSTYPAACPSGGTYPADYGDCLQFTVIHDQTPTDTCTYSSLRLLYPSTVMTYWLSGGTVYKSSTNYTATSPGGTCTASTGFSRTPVISNLSNGSTPLFTYYDGYGNELATSGTNLNPFALAATIKVELIEPPAGANPAIELDSSVALRNNRTGS